MLLKAKDHRHGVGEDTSRCKNCKLDAVAAEMSEFESWAWNWYWENASGWAARIGITASEFMRMKLRGEARRLFIKAMQMIEEMIRAIREKEAK